MQETSGTTIPDDSGQGNDGAVGASNGSPWLTASGVTWGDADEGTSGGCIGFWNKTVIDYSTATGKTFLFHMRFQHDASPASNSGIVANANNLDNDSGIKIGSASGSAPLSLLISDGEAHNHLYGTNQFGSTVDSTTYAVTYILDGSGRQQYGWLDGVEATTWSNDLPTDFVECTMADLNFAIGANTQGGAAFDVIVQDVHLMVLPSLPSNYQQVAQLLANRPFVPLIDAEFDF